MKVKKISTLEIKSISTFNTRMTMFRGSKVGSLNLLKKKSCKFNRALKQVREPDSDDRNRDRYEGKDYREDSPRHKIVDVFKRKNIGKTVV